MIESYYWKEELGNIAKIIEPVRNPPKFSERKYAFVERNIIIGFFIIRRLSELYKLSSKIRNFKIIAYRHKSKREVTWLNDMIIEKNYNFDEGEKEMKSALYLANQVIHAQVIYVVRDEDRNWDSLIVVSERDLKKHIFVIPISEIRKFFLAASQDYFKRLSFKFNEEKQDYDITTD